MSGLKPVTSALSKMVGFGIGMALLGAATLIMIPSLIRASSADAFAALVVGQTTGALGAVVISYGWVVQGPATIAKASPRSRLVEYAESMRVRIPVSLPVTAMCVAIALAVVQTNPLLTILGCLSTSLIGLTASWFFVGTGQPYLLLVLETGPRVIGAVAGILIMEMGSSAAWGITCQIAGLIIGVALSTTFILLPGRRNLREPLLTRPIKQILKTQRHGVSMSAFSSLYGVLPILIIGMVAPALVAPYGVLDKLQKQISSAVSPFVQVLQGWVPRASGVLLKRRASSAVRLASAAGLTLAIALTVIGLPLVAWLGDNQISVSFLAIALVAFAIALSMIGSVLSLACLVPLGKIAVVSKLTFWGFLTGILLIAPLSIFWGIEGALVGISVGLLVRIVAMMVVFLRIDPAPSTPESKLPIASASANSESIAT